MRPVRIISALAALFLLAAQIVGHGAEAQEVLRDAETEQFLGDMGRPLIEAAGLDPKSVAIRVVNDPSINAFATVRQQVFLNSGLIIRATDLLELEGVVAHELGHVAGGHTIRFTEGTGPATNISLLGLVAGIALAAAGAGDAGMAAMMMGQQAAMGKFLAFSREQETRADQAGASYLNKAGIDGSGMIQFFRILQGDDYRLALPQDDGYASTHPLNRDRIASLEHVLQQSPAWGKGADPRMQARYQRIRAKLIGYVSLPAHTFAAYPESDQSVAAHMARAYAYHKLSKTSQAVAEMDAALKEAPDDPYLLEIKGQVLLESGQVKAAIPALQEAVKRTDGQPLIASMLGHALVQEGDSAHDSAMLDEAEHVLRASIARDPENPFAWLQLAIIYDRRGDGPRLALATAERLSLVGGDPRGILRSAQAASRGLKEGTPEWLWAKDIEMVARQQVKQKGKKKQDDD